MQGELALAELGPASEATRDQPGLDRVAAEAGVVSLIEGGDEPPKLEDGAVSQMLLLLLLR